MDFLANAGANALGSLVGVIAGVPAALWLERRRQRGQDASERERICTRRETVERLLSESVARNLIAINAAEIDVSLDRPLQYSGLVLETWEVLKPELASLLDDPVLVALLSTFFSKLREFSAMLERRAAWTGATHGSSREQVRQDVVRLGPELRHDGESLVNMLSMR